MTSLIKAGAVRRYNEMMHIIKAGAYSESDPDGNADGSYWYDDMNISEEIGDLEIRVQGEGFKFVGKDRPNKETTYTLEPLTDEEKAELAAVHEAHRAAGLAAVFQWQDEGTPASLDYTYVLGKLPGTETYVVLAEGTADSGFGYTYPVKTHLTVSHKEDGTPVIGDPTEEQIAHVQASEVQQ